MKGVAIGIDYGTVRIGVAASDALGILASPLQTLQVDDGDPILRIVEIAAAREAETVVVGLPLRMDGTEGTAAHKVRAFLHALRQALPLEVEITTVDERLTTQQAHQLLDRSKKRRSQRSTRAIIDQAAAVLILQDFLDHRLPAPAPDDHAL